MNRHACGARADYSASTRCTAATAIDPTGIGGWSDAQIARAIRAGVSRDGRALHWQGMTWDHASNWDEEDVRALVVYLRSLPPVRHAIPAPRPPAPDDCVVYSFWVKRSAVPGCR